MSHLGVRDFVKYWGPLNEHRAASTDRQEAAMVFGRSGNGVRSLRSRRESRPEYW